MFLRERPTERRNARCTAQATQKNTFHAKLKVQKKLFLVGTDLFSCPNTNNQLFDEVLRYTHIPTPLDDSTRPLENSTNSTLHNPQRAGALVTSIIMHGGPHGWVPVNTHSTPVLPKWEEAVGSSQSTTPT